MPARAQKFIMAGKSRNPFPWPQWQPLLERLAAEGRSASEIATELSLTADRDVSRCAVIGRMWRTGVKSLNPPGLWLGAREAESAP